MIDKLGFNNAYAIVDQIMLRPQIDKYKRTSIKAPQPDRKSVVVP